MSGGKRPFVRLAESLTIDESCNQEKIASILNEIDQIHRTPQLPKIRIVMVMTGPPGQFDPGTMTLSLAAGDPQARITLVHEIGHVLDLYGFDPSLPDYASRSGLSAFARWDQAVRNSRAYRRLRQQLDQAEDLAVVAYIRYLVDPVELWARSYSQFVTKRSGRFAPAITRELDGIMRGQRRRGALSELWEWDDFGPIDVAIEHLLESISWLR